MYKPINGWTRDKMIKHIEDNFTIKSEGPEETCLYRHPDGQKCAVGIFIPDNKYDSDMENIKASGIPKRYSFMADLMPLDSYGLNEYQNVHDDSDGKNTKQELIDWVRNNVE